MSRLRDLLALSDLARWNVVPTSRGQSVAQHSYRVAVIAREIYRLWKADRGVLVGMELYELLQILEWCIDHDGPECLTGDLPSAFKDSIPADQLALVERSLCPWYGEAQQVSALTKTVVGIAEAIESSAWLAVFGLTGTEPLVSDLRRKAMTRCDRANIQWPGLGAAGRSVAESVWREEFPLVLRREQGQPEHPNHYTEAGHATRSGTETGPTEGLPITGTNYTRD